MTIETPVPGVGTDDAYAVMRAALDTREVSDLSDRVDEALADGIDPAEGDQLATEAMIAYVAAILDADVSREQKIAALVTSIRDYSDVAAEEEMVTARVTENVRALHTILAVVNKFGPFELTPADRDAVEALGIGALNIENVAPFHVRYSLSDSPAEEVPSEA